MNQKDDKQIIEEILAGRVERYGLLVKKYETLVFTLALRMVTNREDAEEVAQDVFVKAFHALNTYKGDAKFSTWLYRITYNSSLDMLSRKRRQPAYYDLDNLQHTDLQEVENALDKMEAEERDEQIKKAITMLPEEEAFLITVYYYDEQSVKELAEITGLSESNVKIKLYRGRKRLFTLLGPLINAEKKSSYERT